MHEEVAAIKWTRDKAYFTRGEGGGYNEMVGLLNTGSINPDSPPKSFRSFSVSTPRRGIYKYLWYGAKKMDIASLINYDNQWVQSPRGIIYSGLPWVDQPGRMGGRAGFKLSSWNWWSLYEALFYSPTYPALTSMGKSSSNCETNRRKLIRQQMKWHAVWGKAWAPEFLRNGWMLIVVPPHRVNDKDLRN